MANPTARRIALWIADEVCNKDFCKLSDIAASIIKNHLTAKSEEDICEIVEEQIDNITYEIENINADYRENGIIPKFELSSDGYIKSIETPGDDILEFLMGSDPKWFERFCAYLLKHIGADEAISAIDKNDGGVDFTGFRIPIENNIPMPNNAKVLVIGQAKRYVKGNYVSETDVRKFLGGAVREHNKLKKSGNVGGKTPVIFAFWTTSEFQKNALDFCKDMGIWYANGTCLAQLVSKSGIDISVIE